MSELVRYFTDRYLEMLESDERQGPAILLLANQIEETLASLDRSLSYESYARLRRLLRTLRIRYGYQTDFVQAHPSEINVELPDALVNLIVSERAEISGAVLSDVQLQELTRLVESYVSSKPGKLSGAIRRVNQRRKERRHVAIAVRSSPGQNSDFERRSSHRWHFIGVSSFGKEVDLAVPGSQIPDDVQHLLYGITTKRPVTGLQSISRRLAPIVAHPWR